jgi:hypothetical protein
MWINVTDDFDVTSLLNIERCDKIEKQVGSEQLYNKFYQIKFSFGENIHCLNFKTEEKRDNYIKSIQIRIDCVKF